MEYARSIIRNNSSICGSVLFYGLAFASFRQQSVPSFDLFAFHVKMKFVISKENQSGFEGAAVYFVVYWFGCKA